MNSNFTNHGNFRLGACALDHAWQYARWAFACVVAVAFLVTSASGQYDHGVRSVGGTTTISPLLTPRIVPTFSQASGASVSARIRLVGGAMQTLPRSLTFSGTATAGASMTSASQPVEVIAPSFPVVVEVTNSSGVLLQTINLTAPQSKGLFQWGGASSGNWIAVFPPPSIVISGDGLTYGLIGWPEAPIVAANYKSGVLVLDNATGSAQTVQFGDETLELEPGVNLIPFFGEVDENGFPKARPAGMGMNAETGPDGHKYFSGRLVSNFETGVPSWSGIAPMSLFPPSTSLDGPTLKLPNGMTPTQDVYLDLPAGMNRGNVVPLPGGMSVGSPQIPAGVTPGANGALPRGVLSGGTRFLPSGVSAGTSQGNPVAAGGTGGGGGGITTMTGDGVAVVGSGSSAITGPSTEGIEGNFIPGASMSGMLGDGKTQGRDLARKLSNELKAGVAEINSQAAPLLSGAGPVASYWTAPANAISGSDLSWASFTLPLAEHSVSIVIPQNWIALIRAVLLWGVKIWFVWSVLKLLMR